VWILYSDIVDCRAGRGAAFGRGVVSIGCHVTGCTAVDASCTLAYRSYNHYNDVYEGNGAGSGGLLSHASGCAALNCTFIGNNSDTAYGAAASEKGWVFNCALIANRYEAATAARCVVSNCVTTFGETLYATTPGCVGGVSKYQVYSPVAGDFQPVAGSALIGAGSKDAIADWGANWVPSDYIGLDFYGNPRPYGAGDSVDVGAVQSSANPPTFGCGRVYLNSTSTAATFGGKTYRAKTETYGTSWIGLAEHPLAQIRFTCDRTAGEAVYAYEVIGYEPSMAQKFSVNMYPDSRTDEGVYINPPNGDIPTYSVSARKATDIKWADPTRDDYSGADGSESNPYETLQEAVNAVAANGVVYAKPGVYDKGVTIVPINVANDGQDTNSTPNRVYIDKEIRVASTGGAAVTTIEGAHDDSATGAYDGCGPQAVRCVLAKQDVKCAVQGFTFKDGATDGDLANRGRWDKNSQGQPRFNKSDDIQRGNFGGGGFRAANWNAREAGVVTDSIFTNCTAYWGGAVYGGIAQRCLFVGNTAVSNDPGSVNAPLGVALNAVLLGCLVRDNFVGKNSIVTASDARFTTLYKQTYNGANYVSHIGEDTSPKADTACVDAAHGDFRLRSTTGMMKKTCPKNESRFVRFSTSDISGRPVLFYDKDNCAAGAVQDAALYFVTGTDFGSGYTSSKPDGYLNPGESLTITATGTRPVAGYQIGGSVADPIVTNTTDRSFTFTAPPVSGKVYKDYDIFRFKVRYAQNVSWYVDPAKSDDNDGSTPETARKTLAGAMGLELFSGDTVWAAPGVYEEGTMIQSSNIMSGKIVNQSRVVIPEGVTLRASSSAADTFIKGWKDPASPSYSSAKYFGCGPNAVRGVTMYGNAKLIGFTVCDCATDWNNPAVNENNYGAGVFCKDNTAVIEDCVITNCHARYAAGAYKGSFSRCKFIRCGASSTLGGVTNGEYRDCYFNQCFDQVIGYASVIENCTIGPDCTLWHGTSAMGHLFAGSCRLKNCTVLSPQTGTDTGIAFENCRLLKDLESKITPAEGSSANAFLTKAEMMTDAEGRPQFGSPLIDAGDGSLLVGATADGDVDGGQRIYNGAVDIGCYEYDWRPQYAQDLKHRRITVTAATPNVVETVNKNVLLTDGQELAIAWPGRGARYRANFTLTGTGTLTIRDGAGATLATYTAAGDQSYTVEESDAATRLTFAYAGDGDVTLGTFMSDAGLKLIIR